MGTTPHPANDETPGKASEWLIVLTESPDNIDLRQRFETWLAENPLHAADWAEMSRTCEVMGLAVPFLRQDGEACVVAADISISAPVQKIQQGRAAGMPSRQHRRRRVIPMLAAFAAAACFVLLLGPDVVLRLQADHLTGTGEQRTVLLSDGSKVYLGPQSAISVNYSNDRRQISLLRGEAFFDVAHDAGRPFTVKAQNTGTTDIGTAFDIRLNERDTDIAVKQGLVQLDTVATNTSVSARLKAGDWARVDSAGQMERGSMAPDEIAAWTHGQLIVKNRPTGEVIDQLRPYYHGLILIRGDALARQTLTGVYNLADPIGALRAVAQAQGAIFRQISPWMLVISAS